MAILRSKRVKAALDLAEEALREDKDLSAIFNWSLDFNIVRATRIAGKLRTKATRAAFEEGAANIAAVALEGAEQALRKGDGFFTNQFDATYNITCAEQLAHKVPCEAMRTVMRDGLTRIFTLASQRADSRNGLGALAEQVQEKLRAYQPAPG
jgi:hypothetical protein